MKHLLLAVFDVKMGAYMPPFCAVAIGQASRMFEDAVSQAEGPMGRHPEDYRLFLLGHWDDSTGLVDNLTTPQLVREGVDCVSVPPVRLQEVKRG